MAYTINTPKDLATEYETDAYIALNDIFEEMVDTVYNENSFRSSLSNILTDVFTLKRLEDTRYNILLSIYFKGENVLDYCICVKDGLFYDFKLYREKDGSEK